MKADRFSSLIRNGGMRLEWSERLNLDAVSLELRLILSCLRASLGRDEGDRIRTLCLRGIDWDAFVELVDRHRVPSPVYRNLKRFAEDIIPEPVLTRLRNRLLINTYGVLAKTGELVRIVKRFEEEGIPVLPIKGPVLAQQAYGNIGSRHVGDLDIMIPLDRLKQAENILLAEGYQRTNPHFKLTQKQYSVYVRDKPHFEYFHPGRKISVELHWRFGANRSLFPLGFDDLWRDRQTVRIGSADIPALSLAHTILLSVHPWGHARLVQVVLAQ